MVLNLNETKFGKKYFYNYTKNTQVTYLYSTIDCIYDCICSFVYRQLTQYTIKSQMLIN